jgi:hypothetical protein
MPSRHAPRLGRDYTDAERAVLTIATEVRHRGYCDLHVDTIAANTASTSE